MFPRQHRNLLISVLGAGEIVLVENTTGKGHITRSSSDGPRHTIFVPID